MILWPEGTKVFLADQPVDFRKSVNGLCALVSCDWEKNPGDRNVYVFFNKRRNSLKLLYYDGNGFMLWYKRLDRGQFKLTKGYSHRLELDERQLKWLLSGLDFMALKTLPMDYKIHF